MYPPSALDSTLGAKLVAGITFTNRAKLNFSRHRGQKMANSAGKNRKISETLKIRNRTKQLQAIVDGADEKAKPILQRLVNDAIAWELQLDRCRERLKQIELTPQTKSEYKFFSKLAKDAQQQYTAVSQVILKQVGKMPVDDTDEFDEFLNDVREGV